MLVVHATRAFRDRVPGPAAADEDTSTTALGSWYATIVRQRRQLALLVNQSTLLPLLTPLAPAATLITRIPTAVADLLLAHRMPAPLVAAEHAAMADIQLAPTVNRSIVGVLNEFSHLTNTHQPDTNDLLDLPSDWRELSPDPEI